jgi:ribosomal protein S27AE
LVRVEGAPSHREAYPWFDIRQAKAAHDRWKSPVCVFSEGKGMIGQLLVSQADWHGNPLSIRYVFALKHVKLGQGDEYFSLNSAPSGIDPNRKSIQCPMCARSIFKIYFADRWACAECHGLIYRSQLIGKNMEKYERRAELLQLVGRGRPKHMRSETFVALRQELRDLGEWLGRRVFVANQVHSLKIVPKWKPAAEVGDLWLESDLPWYRQVDPSDI